MAVPHVTWHFLCACLTQIRSISNASTHDATTGNLVKAKKKLENSLQTGVCVFHRQSQHRHTVFLGEGRRRQKKKKVMPYTSLQSWLQNNLIDRIKLTQYAGLSLEYRTPLSKPHGSAHLPWIVFWHVNHLQRNQSEIRTEPRKHPYRTQDSWSQCMG